ncbi:MAG TPA: hypothetical protein VM695_15625 [Phycisphaerae bacterium]|nr:hypothetical protein [Phycisphaerae bacterium]
MACIAVVPILVNVGAGVLPAIVVGLASPRRRRCSCARASWPACAAASPMCPC